jgi:hypothetical protein
MLAHSAGIPRKKTDTYGSKNLEPFGQNIPASVARFLVGRFGARMGMGE